jgi:hypothetical protein
MTVRELRKFLKKMEDYAVVVIPGGDHTLKVVKPSAAFAVKNSNGFTEYLGDEQMKETDLKVDVVIFE